MTMAVATPRDIQPFIGKLCQSQTTPQEKTLDNTIRRKYKYDIIKKHADTISWKFHSMTKILINSFTLSH